MVSDCFFSFRPLKISTIVFFVFLVAPIFPKIQILPGFNIYVHEIVLIITFPFFLKNILFGIQRNLLIFWGVIFYSTLFSLLLVFDLSGVFRIVKGIIYLPLFFLGYHCFYNLKPSLFTWIFIIASIFNLFFLWSNISEFGLNVWDVKTISSGFSNKVLIPSTFSIQTLEKPAHGIWGNYNVLVLLISLYFYHIKRLSLNRLLIVLALVLINLGLGVSREGLISLCFVLIAIFVYNIRSLFQYRLRINVIIIAIVLVFVGGGIFIQYGEEIPLLNKVFYTIESFENSGTEGNIQLRINGWLVFFDFVIHNPMYFFTGLGYNEIFYQESMATVETTLRFAEVPESFFIFSLASGGILGLAFGILFFVELFVYSYSIENVFLKFITISFLLSLLIGNVFSGASIISDLFYGHLLLFFGYIRYLNEETNSTYYRSK